MKVPYNQINAGRKCLPLRFLSYSAMILSAFFGTLLRTPSASAQATDVYITPDGSGQGACTSSPHSPAWFNISSNWGFGSTQIGPGSTVHLCGTFTGAAGVSFFIFQGSGTSGHVITLKFETGAILQAPYIGTGISLNSQSFVVIDGGTNGLIQNTNNGDPAGRFAYQQGTTGIDATGSHDYEIKNLTMKALYVKSDPTYTGIVNDAAKCITFNGSNALIHDNTMSDAGWCIDDGSYNSGDTNVQIYNNTLSNVDHGIALAGGSVTAGSFYIYGNRYSNPNNWDSNANSYHHNFLHAFDCSGGPGITALFIYNNYYFGNPGNNSTSAFFLEGGSCLWSSSGRSYFWNNVFTTTTVIPGLGYISASGAGTTIVNNTMIGSIPPNVNQNCVGFGSASVFENNILEGCAQNIASVGATSVSMIDYNIYADSSSGNPLWQIGSASSSTLAGWRTACLAAYPTAGCDVHSTYSPNPIANINTFNGTISAGFSGLGTGTNLTSLSAGALTSLGNDTTLGNTRISVARPSVGAWTVGSFEVTGTTTSQPGPPVGLLAVVN
jgi:hypothetical protein